MACRNFELQQLSPDCGRAVGSESTDAFEGTFLKF